MAKPVVVTDADFDQTLGENPLVMVDFWAEWCAPCRMIAPILEELAREYEGKLLVAKLDVDENPKTAMRYRVMSIPTVILFKNGQPVEVLVGAQPKRNFEAKIQKHLPPERMRIALDAMGGDRAPGATVQGALLAAREGVEVLLVGEEVRLREELARQGGALPLRHAPDWIPMAEHATEVRRRRESSIMVAMDLLKRGEVQAVVSMGHTGATMAAALFTLGRVKGVERPALLVEFPNPRGRTFLLDGGANADCRPSFLVQFAAMGLAYAEALGLPGAKVGLLSIGEEEGKGNALVLEAYPLLKAALGGRFYGNVEGRDIFLGTAEVVVTDGFTGNVALKLAEGEAQVLLGWVKEALTSSPWAKLGALLAKGALRKVKERVDPAQYGAMPLLGVEGAVFIGHGSADALAVKNALLRARRLVAGGLMDRVRSALAALHV